MTSTVTDSNKYSVEQVGNYIFILHDGKEEAKFFKHVIETFPVRVDVWIEGQHQNWVADRVARYFHYRHLKLPHEFSYFSTEPDDSDETYFGALLS